MSVHPYALDDRGLRYVQSELKVGSELARIACARLDLERGQVVAFLPDDVSEDDLYDFDSGRDYKAGLDWLANYVRECLVLDNVTSCILDCQLISPQSPFLDKWRESLIYSDNEVYFGIDNRCSVDDIKIALLRSKTAYPHQIGFLSDYELVKTADRSAPPLGWMDKIMDDPSLQLIVQAYDGEGYLLWLSKI